jgi:CheY-like chemotaxis protein
MATILIVEDNPDDAELLRLQLVKLDHKVLVAQSGTEGLAAARAWEPDVVMCDLDLPDQDGFELAKILGPSGVRLIAVTGSDSPLSRQLASDYGFQTFLGKPVSPGALSLL